MTISNLLRPQNPDLDVLIIGAGYAGIYLLYKLRNKGYNVKIFEAEDGLGGTWRMNRYPGARVDSDVPTYELSIPEVWKTWTWTQLYPGWEEIQDYFEHCDKVLGLKEDVEFSTRVVGAEFDVEEGKWKVEMEGGKVVKAKYFIPCVGFAAKRYIPDFPGLDTFEGEVHHSSAWPKTKVDVSNKRCAVIGTGSSGVQIIQEWAKKSLSLTVFQRTPNLALPMRQRNLTEYEQNCRKNAYPDYFLRRSIHHGGFPYGTLPKNTFDDTPEEREHVFECLWQKGGFAFWIGAYFDLLLDQKANREAYDFWVKKVRARIIDSRKRDILAPLEPIHPFGVKRPSLEQDYYEMLNKENVDVISLRETPIVEVKPNGIVTSDGKLHELDIIALATGFDAVTGGLLKIDPISIDNTSLAKKWSDGVKTFMGITISGFPNMFFVYGPQAPTAFANGPTLAELQGDWIINVIDFCEANNIKYMNPDEKAEEKWVDEHNKLASYTLFPSAETWYMGTNIPGKKKEMLNYVGGIPNYMEMLRKSLRKGLEGFVLTKKDAQYDAHRVWNNCVPCE